MPVARPLTVLSVAYPFAPVGPDAVGGAEQVLSLVDTALVRGGHRSIVIAAEGSRVAGLLRATPRAEGPLDRAAWWSAHHEHRGAINEVLQSHPVDLVHLHGVDFYRYLPPPGVAVVVTLHLPLSWYPAEVFQLTRPDTYFHCVSSIQRRDCPPELPLLPDIENGVPVNRLTLRVRKRSTAVCLGRICPEKGFHLALDAAHRAHHALNVAGEVFHHEQHERYFREEIVPRLDRSRRYIGVVNFERKRRLLASARCLAAPSLVPETSSLVAMEALACGTPVVAFPAGALTQIVDPGITGFIVHDEQEMAEAMGATRKLDPEACRQMARERFSEDRTARRYLELFHWLSSRSPASV
jgi:glycosyltransferase involved in cell wall biosynthesis